MADATGLELTIKGDVQALRLRAGDRVLVTVRGGHVTADQMSRWSRIVQEAFPDNEVVVLAHADLTVLPPVEAEA